MNDNLTVPINDRPPLVIEGTGELFRQITDGYYDYDALFIDEQDLVDLAEKHFFGDWWNNLDGYHEEIDMETVSRVMGRVRITIELLDTEGE